MRQTRGVNTVLFLAFLLGVLGGAFGPYSKAFCSNEEVGVATPEGPREGDLQQQWDQMDPDKKEALVRRYRQWRQLPPERREAIRRNLDRFDSLSEGEKKRIRHRYRAFKGLPPEQKIEILKNYDRWQSLSTEEKQRLRDRYGKYIQRLSPDERRRLREYYQRHHRLPPAVRDRLRKSD